MLEADTMRIKREFKQQPRADVLDGRYRPIATAAVQHNFPEEWALVQASERAEPRYFSAQIFGKHRPKGAYPFTQRRAALRPF